MRPPEDEHFRTLTKEQLWQRYCGYLDLSVEQFLDIQEELLIDQIGRIADSVLGKKIMGNKIPGSVEEFRQVVPLTTYEDYMPYLGDKQEDALAVQPCFWCHSAGRGGSFKWIPYTWEFVEIVIKRMMGGFMLASRNKGMVNISPGIRFLVIVPPPTYASGCVIENFPNIFSCKIIPPPKVTANLEFQDRIQKAFQIALKDGADVIGGIASVLVRIGEAFSGEARGTGFNRSMLHPKIMFRLLRAMLKAKKEKRTVLPKDIWPNTTILTGGVDTAIYREDISHYWGSEPHEFYGCTESFFLAIQSWNRKELVFLPDTAFFEFIPYEEHLKSQQDKEYQPKTVLINEVQEGQIYEVVLTQLYGMPLLRHRIKDLVKATVLRDDEGGVNLPHFIFQRRADEVINLGSMFWLDERTLWKAIVNTGIKYVEWSACKEYDHNNTYLRLYIELKEKRDSDEIADLIHEQLKEVDTDYKDVETYLGQKPVRITILPGGTFDRYTELKRSEGADLAHLKPGHINPPDESIKRLVEISST